ncbi:glycosyltransferase family 9 protein [Salmonella enterica]
MRLGTFHKKKKRLINLIKINLLSFFYKTKHRVSLENKIIRTCLLIHDNNKIGDLIVLSALYRALAQKGIKLYILTGNNGYAFLKGHPNITHFFVKNSSNVSDTLRLRRELRKYHFDIVLDPFETFPCFTHSLLLAGLNANYILGFDKWYKRYYTSYDAHDENLHEHMSMRVKVIMQHLFGSNVVYDERYDLYLPPEVEASIRTFIGNTHIVIVNPLGAKKICRLTSQQIEFIHGWLRDNRPDLRVVYTGHPDDLHSINIKNVETLPYKDFIYAIALAKYCSFMISVDTALVHIASAYNRPILAIYPAARRASYPSPLIWAPNNDHALQIISQTFSVSDIDQLTLLSSLEKFFTQQKSES